MKKLILLLIWAVSSYQCSSQKINTMQQDAIIPKITKYFEVFDIKKYNNGKKEGSSLFEREDDILKIYQIVNSGKYYQEFYKENFFSITKSYYPNNNIKFKGITFNYEGFSIGVWYYFNEDGSYSHEVNYDTSYKFTLKDIMQFCKDNNIVLEKGYGKGGWITSINRTEYPAKPFWRIQHYVLGEQGYVETIVLDGITGKEIERIQRDLPRE